MRKLGLALASAAVLWIGVGEAHAALLIDAGPASVPQTFFGGNYVAGTEFTTTAPMTIRSLGWLDVEGDGLLFDSRVGLWDASTQSLLASATVTNAGPTVVSAQGTAIWHLAAITPIVIGPGTYRVAGEVGSETHLALSDDRIGNGVTLSPGYVRTDFPNGGFGFPGLAFTSQAIRATLSTDSLAPPPVPEPSTLVLMGVAGLMGLRRRKHSRG